MYRGTAGVFALLLTFLGVWLGGRFLLPIALPFLLGLLLALAAEPLVRLLNRRLKLPRALSAGVGVSLTFCAVTILILMACAFAVRELGMLAGVLPDLEVTARSGLALVEGQMLGLTDRLPPGIRSLLQRNVTGFFSDGNQLLNRAVQYVLGLAGSMLTHVPDSALTLGTGVVSAFMISAKLPRLRAGLLRRFPRERLQKLLPALEGLKNNLGSWFLAQIKLMGLCFGVLLAGFWLLRVPYPLLWAGIVCLVDAVPVLGTGTVLLPWAFLCFLREEGARALGLLGIYAVVTVSRSVLEPRLLGRHLGLDPLATLVAIYAGYKLWGLGGMILAPLLAVTALQLSRQRCDKL